MDTISFIKRMFHRNFHPFAIRIIDLQDDSFLLDVWRNVLNCNPLDLTKWDNLLKYLKIASALSTTLYLIKEETKALPFDNLVFRIIKILSSRPIPTSYIVPIALNTLFLKSAGNVQDGIRKEILGYIEKNGVFYKTLEGIQNDKVNKFIFHYLSFHTHVEFNQYHLMEMRSLEKYLKVDTILLGRFSILDRWSFMFVQKGRDEMKSLGVTPELYHTHLMEFKECLDNSYSSIQMISPEWSNIYQTLLECKFAMFYAFILFQPSEALTCVSNILKNDLSFIGRHVVLQFPSLLDICSTHGADELWLELKKEYDKYKFSSEIYYAQGIGTQSNLPKEGNNIIKFVEYKKDNQITHSQTMIQQSKNIPNNSIRMSDPPTISKKDDYNPFHHFHY
eukprot:TRINITY_DN5537_c0_g1_i1.p1 TRINITY_DN5537_c0_g1~~TRINITY_DN5537_c0_g1_i1.p1  ORF type:complete len:461 (-),score=87.96 TRINITY_DN5537_c0_g1_i1:508-1683(-)